MALPYLNYTVPNTPKMIGQFLGLNTQVVIAENEFCNTRNVSNRSFPIIESRRERGVALKNIQNPNGLLHKNGFFYVDGSKCYYEDSYVGEVSNSVKTLVGMGAYILIFPDKKCFNTETRAFVDMNKIYYQQGVATFSPVIHNSAFTKIEIQGLSFSRFDSVEISGCVREEYNKTTVINEVGDNYIIVTGSLKENFTQNSGIVIKRLVPDFDFVCESNNRLWACSNSKHEIYASRLGDPFNWKNFEGLASDSYAVTVGSDGDFTGCISHMGYVLFFKENMILKVFGSKPSNFQLTPYTVAGVKKGCGKSLTIINETLYYVGVNGMECKEAVGGYEDGILYLSCKVDNKNNSAIKDRQTLFTYNGEYKTWLIEDDTKFKYATNDSGKLYYIDQNNDLKAINGDSKERISWLLESGNTEDGTMLNKYISKMQFNLWLEKDAKAEIYLKYDNSPEWHRIQTINSRGDKTYMIPIIPKRSHKIAYKIEGKGKFRLLGLARYISTGSEIG